MRTSTRVLLSFTLLVALSAGAAHAASWSRAKAETPSLLSSLWGTLVSEVTAIWEKARGGFDPNGVTAPEPVPVPASEGETEGRGGFDPNG